jgi:putative FmdB family regulatory protein
VCDFAPEEVNALPLYAYRCTQCGHHFEKIQHFKSKPELVCPVCQGVLERPLTAPRLRFKGGGFYINDYAGKSSAPASEPAPAEIKTPCGGSCGAACPAVAAASSAPTSDSSKN